MFERFSDGARRSIVLAQEAARELGHDHLGTEHLLLGLIEEGTVNALLTSLDVSVEAVRTRVLETIGRRTADPAREIPFTPESKVVLERAMRETVEMGWGTVGPEHLLHALVEEDEGVAAKVLRGFGVTGTGIMRVMVPRGERPAIGEAGGEPRCPSCGEDVTVSAVARRLEIPGEEGEDPVLAVVVACRQCSRILGVLPAP